MSLKRYTKHVAPATFAIKLMNHEIASEQYARYSREVQLDQFMLLFFLIMTVGSIFSQEIGSSIAFGVLSLSFLLFWRIDKKEREEWLESQKEQRKNLKSYFQECLDNMDEAERKEQDATEEAAE